MIRLRLDSVGWFWFFSHFSTAVSVIPMPNISASLRCDNPRSTRFWRRYSPRRSVLETMRQPLQEGRGTISRAAGSMTFPSQFMLVAAMNPTDFGKVSRVNLTCAPGCGSFEPRTRPGKSKKSLLLIAVAQRDDEAAMPPKRRQGRGGPGGPGVAADGR